MVDLDKFDGINEKMRTYNARTVSIGQRVIEMKLTGLPLEEQTTRLYQLMDELGENQKNMGMAMLEFVRMVAEEK
jgi:hypothetical protein